MEEKQKDQKRVNPAQGWRDSVSSFFKARVPLFRKVGNVIRHPLKFAEDHLGLLTVIVLAGFTLFSILGWGWLRDNDDGESGSTTVRNLGLIAAAIIAFPLAIWRSIVADRQSKTAQRSLLNERYQKGAEMLGSKVLSVRLGGIDALERLAQEHAEDYHIRIIKILCAFVRNPQKDENDTTHEDVQAIMTILGRRRNKEQREIENQEIKISKEPILNLVGAKLFDMVLDGVDLSGADLSGAWPHNADLSSADLRDAKLSSADLRDAKLSGAWLEYADLSGVRLAGADLSGVRLKGAHGLTQAQLDEAVAPEKPPKLEGAEDSETGKPLVWHDDDAPPSSSS